MSENYELMKRPLIGITTDLDGEYLKLKHHYCGAITGAGGIPVLIPPVGKSLPYTGKIDGLLIPGGADLNPRYYDEEMSSVSDLFRNREAISRFLFLKK